MVGVIYGVDRFGDETILRKAPETILWAAQLQVGADGKTQVKVDAPRQPSRWRILARAASGSDRFGLGELRLAPSSRGNN